MTATANPDATIYRTAREVVAALSAKYCAPEYAFFEQVRNGTGYFQGQRYADGMAMGLWPSRGLHLHGFEVKVSRSDWVRELKNPAKADDLVAYCDFWWIVIGNAKIVEEGELPPTWGLLVPHKDGLKVKVQAPKLQPTTLDHQFLAALLRRAHEVRPDMLELEAARKHGYAQAKKDAERDVEYANGERSRLQEKVAEFEKASGISIRNSWNLGDIGRAARTVLSGKHNDAVKQLERAKAGLDAVSAAIAKELAELVPGSAS